VGIFVLLQTLIGWLNSKKMQLLQSIFSHSLYIAMNIKTYEEFHKKTMLKDFSLSYLALGLGGECGEVLDKIKKNIRDSSGKMTEEFKQETGKELGDVIWYLVGICKKLGLSLEDVLKQNAEKLESRMKRKKMHGSGDNR
jgi:NTP pyrophosphatase (non-canonical NTP hydrolase)